MPENENGETADYNVEIVYTGNQDGAMLTEIEIKTKIVEALEDACINADSVIVKVVQ